MIYCYIKFRQAASFGFHLGGVVMRGILNLGVIVAAAMSWSWPVQASPGRLSAIERAGIERECERLLVAYAFATDTNDAKGIYRAGQP